MSVNVKTSKNCSLTFYINKMLDIHRTKTENKDRYLREHVKEFKLKLLPFQTRNFRVNRNLTLYIKGLGYIKINGSPDISIDIHQDIEIYKSEVQL